MFCRYGGGAASGGGSVNGTVSDSRSSGLKRGSGERTYSDLRIDDASVKEYSSSPW